MDVFLKAFPPRLLFGVVFAWFVAVTPSFADPDDGSYPAHYFIILLLIYALHQVRGENGNFFHQGDRAVDFVEQVY